MSIFFLPSASFWQKDVKVKEYVKERQEKIMYFLDCMGSRCWSRNWSKPRHFENESIGL